MMTKQDDLEHQVLADKVAKEERVISDVRYARKEFEKAVFWFVSLVVGAVVLALISGVLK